LKIFWHDDNGDEEDEEEDEADFSRKHLGNFVF
jgi:hypothetical protein